MLRRRVERSLEPPSAGDVMWGWDVSAATGLGELTKEGGRDQEGLWTEP